MKEGRAIKVARFAPSRSLLQATFSMGPERAESTLSYADTIREEAEAFPSSRKPAEQIYLASRDSRVGCATLSTSGA